MRVFRFLSDPERWAWFAAGDEPVTRPLSRSVATDDNSPDRIVWEIGRIIAAALALAVLARLASSQ